MRRITQIATPLVVIALIGVGGAFLPVMATPAAAPPNAVGETSLSCPAFSEATSGSKTAVAPGGQVSIAGVGGTTPQVQAGDVAVVANKAAVRLSGATNVSFGGSSLVSAASGPTRGLMLAPCRAPATEAWITGVTSNDSTVTDLVLTNLDQDEAAVDLTFYGADGQQIVAGARGVIIDPTSQRTLPLASLVSTKEPFTVNVTTSQGRVAVVARETQWQGSTSVGSDWVAPSELGSTVVVAGVPGGAGARELVITNPSDRSTTASISALTAEGTIALEGADQLDIPAQSTRTIALESGLQGEAAAIRVTADTAVTAAVRADSATAGATSDIAIVGTGSALPARVSLAVPAGTSGKVQLLLSNAGDADATVTVGFADGAGAHGSLKEVSVVKGGSVAVDAPSFAATMVTIASSQPEIRAALVVRATLGKVQAIAAYSYDGLADHTGGSVTYDPRVNTGG